MDLIALAKNPVPSGATTGYFDAPANSSCALRAGRRRAVPRAGTVCLFQGRGEFIEKYFEVVADLRRRGFGVATMDWRGQGGSQRLLSNPRKGYVRSFADYDQDLADFMKEIVLPDCQPPYHRLAHSMGGHILLRNASLPSSWFSRMVLSAPMIAIAEKRLGAPHGLVARLRGGAGRHRASARSMCAGGSDEPIELRPFEGNPAHVGSRTLSAQPAGAGGGAALGLGSPTVGWLRAASVPSPGSPSPDYPLQRRGAAAAVRGRHGHHRLDAGNRGIRSAPEGRHARADPAGASRDPSGNGEIRQRFWAAFDAYMGR